jgi:glycosyltransferase involved in cell wall biosynthesis
MLQFLPPKKILRFLDYNGIKFNDVPETVFNEVEGKIKALQSDNPLVSVVLIAWNEEDCILATLASVAQTRTQFPMELIVVNNNSTDDTQKFMDRCGVKSVFETKKGWPHARQAGMVAAKGKYIVSGDMDTLYKSTWVEELAKPLLRDEISCSYSLHAFYTDNGKYPLSLLLYQQAKLFGIYLKDMKRPQLNCGGASMAFEKELAMKFGGYNTNVVRGSDGYIALQLTEFGKIKMVSTNKAIIYTSMRRTMKDGNLAKAFWKRFKDNMRYFFHYFSKQKED